MKSIEQQRAANALQRVHDLEQHDDRFKGQYRSYVDRLGPMILMNGLGQALATECAAAGSKSSPPEQAHHAVYTSLEQWLCRKGGVFQQDKKLLQGITESDESCYLHAQMEALAWLEWHKKFCRAMFPVSGGNSE